MVIFVTFELNRKISYNNTMNYVEHKHTEQRFSFREEIWNFGDWLERKGNQKATVKDVAVMMVASGALVFLMTEGIATGLSESVHIQENLKYSREIFRILQTGGNDASLTERLNVLLNQVGQTAAFVGAKEFLAHTIRVERQNPFIQQTVRALVDLGLKGSVVEPFILTSCLIARDVAQKPHLKVSTVMPVLGRALKRIGSNQGLVDSRDRV